MRTFRLIAVLIAAGVAAVAIVVDLGWYTVSASEQHLRPTFWLLQTAKRESIKRNASGIDVPSLAEPAIERRGLFLYREHCVQCHGAPGVAPSAFALGMTPAPTNLAYAALHWKAGELYWSVREGIKMTGMPSWKFRLPDRDLWAIVAFVRRLPELSPAAYAALDAPRESAAELPPAEYAADPERGQYAIAHYACTTCHRVPGVVGPNAPVGPPLDGIAGRKYLAGLLRNTPDNMVRWLRRPQAVNPNSAMPDLGVTERDARDMAAYLSTLR